MNARILGIQSKATMRRENSSESVIGESAIAIVGFLLLRGESFYTFPR